MKYSILTTSNCNNFNIIKRYINSINSQKITADELIFVDDKSRCSYIIEKYLRKNLKSTIKIIFIKNFISLGVAKSLNRGLKVASNQIIFRLDIDDEWKSNHSNYNLNLYKREKNFLIYSNRHSFFSSGIADPHLLLDNPTIHSSWVINKKLCRNFKYFNLFPEDFATLSHYWHKNFRFRIINIKTVNIYSLPFSQSKKKNANKDLKFIKKKNLFLYLQKFSYFHLIKYLGFFGIFKCILR
jgi:glycosyltransferase involved in cell wall biosynthesis